jgi:hypothetical protein
VGVHNVLLWTLLQAKSSVAINMYGFDDPQMVAVIRHHALTEKMLVTLSLDSSEAGVGSEPSCWSSCGTTSPATASPSVAPRRGRSATTS